MGWLWANGVHMPTYRRPLLQVYCVHMTFSCHNCASQNHNLLIAHAVRFMPDLHIFVFQCCSIISASVFRPSKLRDMHQEGKVDEMLRQNLALQFRRHGLIDYVTAHSSCCKYTCRCPQCKRQSSKCCFESEIPVASSQGTLNEFNSLYLLAPAR